MQIQANEVPSGIVLLAKQSGATSFSSLSSIKKALGTSKVGHTGTLDSFADGLLVVLVNRLTRLVPHITGFDKTYLVLIQFGSETDTLDPTGEVVRTGAVPTRAQVESVLPDFIGEIDQVPPLYSAIHVGGGKRASELAREGKAAQIPARKITIYDIRLLDFQNNFALVEVSCSKGTYIRALARDIAAACGSCAHLAALRRTKVGPFELKDAAGAEDLGDFTISALTQAPSANENESSQDSLSTSRSASTFFPKIRAAMREMDCSLAEFCGFTPAFLNTVGELAFANGRPLKASQFSLPVQSSAKPAQTAPGSGQLAVFYPDGHFAGVVERQGKRFGYGFVIPRAKTFAVYTWEQIVDGRLNSTWKEQGCALTIGSFDGPHFGHEALFQAVLAQENLVPGAITFSRSLRGLKNQAGYEGDIATLSQKIRFFEEKGFSFVVVIDFSTDFAKMQGTEFLSKLIAQCNMKFLVEGKDFCCGYKGATDVAQILQFSREHYFDFMAVAPILHEGEKISSSRVRLAIRAGNFSAAEEMMRHPYQLDCSGFTWKKEGKNLVAHAGDSQVLPENGEYEVEAVLSGRTEKSICTVTNGKIQLADMGGKISGIIRAITFR